MESDDDAECYQRGGRVRKGRTRVIQPTKRSKVNVRQIVTVNVTRPQARARGHASKPASSAYTTVQSFAQQPTVIQQPYSLASASGPYQSFGEANYQQRLGEYFKSISEPNKQKNFNEIEPNYRREEANSLRQPVMAEFGSQTAPIQLSKEEIARKRLERFNYGIRMPIDFGGQTDPIKFGDFGTQTEPNKFSNFGTQTDVDKNLSFTEMEKARKRLQPESKPVEEVVMDRTRKPTPPESKPVEEEYKEVPVELPIGRRDLPEVPVEKPPVEPPVEEEKIEEEPRTYRRSKVEADMQRINDVVVGKGKASTGSKEAIRAILGKYRIYLSPSVYTKYALPAIIEKAIRRMQGLNVTDY